MSISMDDLVSSLSTSHIGQEAIDLATLQSQLAQALIELSTTSSTAQNSGSYAQPCNTPTGRTPSNSFSLGQMMDVQRTVLSREDMEDERMVEDILIPASSSGPSSASLFASQPHSPTWAGTQSKVHSRAADLFTTADPFYNAQLQALQTHTTSPSPMAQIGRPSQQSPFLSLTLDNHSLLVATSVAFER